MSDPLTSKQQSDKMINRTRSESHRRIRMHLSQALSFAIVFASGLMMWHALRLILNTDSPVVVVLSGSMEPAFYRGDVLLLATPTDKRFATGDITVYQIPAWPTPIVHRIIEAHDVVSEEYIAASPLGQTQLLLTKGDNNLEDDISLYRGIQWLERHLITGKVVGYVPYAGYATIIMNDYPVLKVILIGGCALLAAFQRD